MNLRGLVAVSGRPGLFKLIGQNKAGYVLESLDEARTKIIANIANTKLASLEDITIYSEGEDLKLADVFANMGSHGSAAPDIKADGAVLRNYFRAVAPDHDEERVYASDMKKIITWFAIIKDLPLFTEAAPGTGAEDPAVKEEKVVEKKPKATAKPVNTKATAKTSAPAKKASMPSKKGA